MTMTTSDIIKAAASVGRDVAEGRLDPAVLDQAAADECKALFGTVAGPEDPLWPLHVDVCRQALAAGALTADEISEHLAVARHRAGEPLSTPEPPVDPPPALSSASRPLSPNSDGAEEIDAVPEPEPEVEPEPQPELDLAAKADCGCDGTQPTMVDLPDGRRIPSRLIVARGRGVPTDNGLREL